MAPKEIEIDPSVGRAGIDCKAGTNEVSKVVAGGQSDKAGVKVGWKVKPPANMRELI